MLFDLQGKRRRVVQSVYLMLAVLMGGGLVLFGIGGDVSGGLFDAFSDRSGGNNEVVEERIERNEERAKANPRAKGPHKELVRDYYALAVGQADSQGVFPAEAQDELRKASVHWNAYLDVEDGKPDASLARVALQVYDLPALNQPQQAVRVARIIAEDGNDAGSYLQLAQYAVLAGDKRIEQLASAKAIDLAPNAQQRKAVRQQLQQIKAAVIAQQLQEGGAQQGGGGGGQGGGQQQNQPGGQ